jgi:hypothetical protein
MPTLVLDPPPIELTNLIQRRRELGQDRLDEMWDGVLHMNPAPHGRDARIPWQLAELLGPLARDAGLQATSEFNLGESDDYRVPDAGLHRSGHDRALLRNGGDRDRDRSPGDETRAKLPFYAAHQVDEVLIVDPQERSVEWLTFAGATYEPRERSELIGVAAGELAARIEWSQ